MIVLWLSYTQTELILYDDVQTISYYYKFLTVSKCAPFSVLFIKQVPLTWPIITYMKALIRQ